VDDDAAMRSSTQRLVHSFAPSGPLLSRRPSLKVETTANVGHDSNSAKPSDMIWFMTDPTYVISALGAELLGRVRL
jgi:hypothetical protein